MQELGHKQDGYKKANEILYMYRKLVICLFNLLLLHHPNQKK